MEHLYDVIVIGGGPAGLTAALYLARARYRVLVIEKEKFGGQITITAEVVNYPGIERIDGATLTETMRKQAQQFGAEFLLAEVQALDMDGELKTVHTSKGALQAFGILLAMGAQPRMVGFRGESEFRGHGVAYCATCDGEFFTDLPVFVVGGGYAAAEEGLFLTKYARSVTILIRKNDFSCAKSLAEEVRAHPKITVRNHTVLEEVGGDHVLRYAKMRNVKTGEIEEYHAPAGETFGVFVFAGYTPATSFVKDLGILDENDYIITDTNQKTSLEGLYAAGDVCIKNLRQVVTAVADGAIAATSLEKYAAAMQEKTNLHPKQPTISNHSSQHFAGKETSESFFTAEIKSQLAGVFEKLQSSIVLELTLDERPISLELQRFAQELSNITDRISVQTTGADANPPCVRLIREDGSRTGVAFHGVPGGHEFNSFILALYNTAGPGQAIDDMLKTKIKKIGCPVSLKICISLSCTMCPDLVTAAQRIAAENPLVSAEVYDINHFPYLREQYQIMSVPCLIMDDKKIAFGKKNLQELFDFIKSNMN